MRIVEKYKGGKIVDRDTKNPKRPCKLIYNHGGYTVDEGGMEFPSMNPLPPEVRRIRQHIRVDILVEGALDIREMDEQTANFLDSVDEQIRILREQRRLFLEDHFLRLRQLGPEDCDKVVYHLTKRQAGGQLREAMKRFEAKGNR